MKYYSLRERIITGDVFLTANPALFSRLIRFFTRSQVSHVGIFLWIGKRLFIAEAIEGSGVILSLASSRIHKEEKCWAGRIPHNQKKWKIEENIFNSLGKKYDMSGALISKFEKSDRESFFCSEFVEFCLGLEKGETKRGTTPDDIARLCISFLTHICK
jgi:hypothetical protein